VDGGIRKRRRRRRPPRGASPRVAIIGGGWGGIIAAVKLKQRGISSFVIFEREEEPGGVWYANTFPGLGVDVPAHLYSFSFKGTLTEYWLLTRALGRVSSVASRRAPTTRESAVAARDAASPGR
jgi:cation diffusion facilitator CzcD-associated flavoprotein CzcO